MEIPFRTASCTFLSRVLAMTAVLLLISCLPALADRYVVDSTTSSTNWNAAKWTNYPDSPTCQPCTPQTAMANAQAGDTVYFRGGSGGNYTFFKHLRWTPAITAGFAFSLGTHYLLNARLF